MRRNDLFDQRGQFHAVERRTAREFGQFRQNRAAAFGLLVKQAHILRMFGIRLDRELQLFGDERDGCKGCAEFMGGGGGQPIELGEMLFASKHQFSRRQRVGELAGFLGDLPGMQADEGDCEQQR